jgi:hypothetical protein
MGRVDWDCDGHGKATVTRNATVFCALPGVGASVRGGDKAVRGQRSDRMGSQWVVCGASENTKVPEKSRVSSMWNPGSRLLCCICLKSDLAAQYKRTGGTRVLDCDQVHECTCSHAMVSCYQSDPTRVGRISGPLLDRADL